MPGRAERRPKAGVEASPAAGWVSSSHRPAPSEQEANPPRPSFGDDREETFTLCAALAAGWVLLFVRCRRAAATAIGAASVTLMSIGGFALTSDHTHLVYQRDTLKAATDAASLAATRHWQQALGHLTDDDDIKEALEPIARRYILANIPENRREKAELQVTLTLHHGPGMVDVSAAADLGGVIFAGWMLDSDAPQQTTRVETRTERIESDGRTIEVALAIDTTVSMRRTLAGGKPTNSEESRMTTVKRAAKDLVDIVTAASDSVAIGVVPWNYRVRVDQATSTRWEDNGWAVKPTRRYYPNPYEGSYKEIPRASTENWFPDPYLVTPAGEWHDLPAPRDPWAGCVDQRQMSGTNPPGISTALPTAEPFTMAFYSPTLMSPHTMPITYLCRRTDPLPLGNNYCYHNPSGLTWKDDKISREQHQSMHCYETRTIMPLTTDISAAKRKIDTLNAKGQATYSTLGVVWGHRLLASAWRTIWNGATHPVDKAVGVQKAIVLLTDGEDNHLDSAIVTQHLNDACTAAKDAGIKIFTIAAMHPDKVGDLAGSLERCSSQADDPDGTYVFINNATSDDLQGAFRQISRQLVRFRRVY